MKTMSSIATLIASLTDYRDMLDANMLNDEIDDVLRVALVDEMDEQLSYLGDIDDPKLNVTELDDAGFRDSVSLLYQAIGFAVSVDMEDAHNAYYMLRR